MEVHNDAAAVQSLFGDRDVKSPQTVDYESFLKLLVAQMKNQDPTSPMESTDFIAQLATFSQVEQSIQINKKLEDMIQNAAMSQATGLIGRYIESMDGTISGRISAVELYSDGVVAILEDGRKVAMSPGVVIREANFSLPEEDEPPAGAPAASGASGSPAPSGNAPAAPDEPPVASEQPPVVEDEAPEDVFG